MGVGVGNGGGGGLIQFYSIEAAPIKLMLLQITNICIVCIRSSTSSVKHHGDSEPHISLTLSDETRQRVQWRT